MKILHVTSRLFYAASTCAAFTLLLMGTDAQAANESHVAAVLTNASIPTLSIWLWLCATVAIIVFGAIVYSVAAFRQSNEAANKSRELAWTLVPIAIVVAAALPAMKSVPAPQDSHASSVAASSADHCVTLLTAATRSTVLRDISTASCSTSHF